MRLAVLLCLVALASGCAAPAPSQADPTPTTQPPVDNEHTQDWTLNRGQSGELNFELAEGATIHYVLRAGAPVTWDLHSHAANGTVETHASGDGRAAEGNFTAPRADVFSIFARSTTSTAITKVTLTGAFIVVE